MKKISFWAKTHKRTARILIVVSFILLNGLGIFIGISLTDIKISIPAIAMIFCCTVYLIALFIYPSKADKGKKMSTARFYLKQKSCDLILVASSFFMFIYVSNHPQVLFQQYSILKASVNIPFSLPKDSVTRTFKSIKDFSASMKDESGKTLKWKERKKLLKDQIRGIKKSNDLSDGAKAGLIILSVLVALGLLILIGALACNLSCSGSDGAALLLGIGGTALVIFLLVITIRAINQKNKKIANKEPLPSS